jgi:RNA polymerase sigma factor (sigma-70 family)
MAAHDGLVQVVVRRQHLGPLRFADALQSGRIGLWHAIMGYDPHRGYAFSTYAWPCIARQVWSAVEQAERDDQRGLQESDAIARIAAVCPDGDPFAAAEAAAICVALADLVARLPQPLHDVIVLHAGLDGYPPQSLASIGRSVGLTRERMRQVHVDALIWLRQPAHSQHLRSLLGRHTLADYQRAQAQSDAWLERRRRGHGR